MPNTHEQGHRGMHPPVEKLEEHQPGFNLIITVETARADDGLSRWLRELPKLIVRTGRER